MAICCGSDCEAQRLAAGYAGERARRVVARHREQGRRVDDVPGQECKTTIIDDQCVERDLCKHRLQALLGPSKAQRHIARSRPRDSQHRARARSDCAIQVFRRGCRDRLPDRCRAPPGRSPGARSRRRFARLRPRRAPTLPASGCSARIPDCARFQFTIQDPESVDAARWFEKFPVPSERRQRQRNRMARLLLCLGSRTLPEGIARTIYVRVLRADATTRSKSHSILKCAKRHKQPTPAHRFSWPAASRRAPDALTAARRLYCTGRGVMNERSSKSSCNEATLSPLGCWQR